MFCVKCALEGKTTDAAYVLIGSSLCAEHLTAAPDILSEAISGLLDPLMTRLTERFMEQLARAQSPKAPEDIPEAFREMDDEPLR